MSCMSLARTIAAVHVRHTYGIYAGYALCRFRSRRLAISCNLQKIESSSTDRGACEHVVIANDD
jgi:hypothetical protein